VEHRRALAVFCAGAIGTLALVLAFQRGQGGHPGRGGGELDVTDVADVAAMRIYSDRTQALPVARVVVGDHGVNLDRPSSAGPPVIRVDMEVRGRHLSVWLRDVTDPAPPPIPPAAPTRP
jgi:hypothetical protein